MFKESWCIILGKNEGVKNSSVKQLLIKDSKTEIKADIGNCFGQQANSSHVFISNPKSFTRQQDCLKEKKNTKEKIFLKTSLNSTCDLSFINNTEILSYVTKQFSLEEILETFFSRDSSLTLKYVNIILKILSNVMKVNPKIKLRVLENLSENHPKDFLEHTVQENLSSVICERLNLKSIIDFICEKSKVNTLCRNILLDQIPEIFTKSKIETVHLKLIQNLLHTTYLTDENIFYLIQLLVNKRVLGRVLDVAESS